MKAKQETRGERIIHLLSLELEDENGMELHYNHVMHETNRLN